MIGLGRYGEFNKKLSNRNKLVNDNEYLSFGILFVDYRQDSSRQYIINYIHDYHTESRDYFDFYLPGYVTDNEIMPGERGKLINDKHPIYISDNTKWFFSPDLYNEYRYEMKYHLGIEISEIPTLVLMSSTIHLSNAKYIIIELDSIAGGIQHSGELFRKIFELAKRNTSLEEFKSKCLETAFKDDIFQIIRNAIASGLGIEWLEKISERSKKYRKVYRIKTIGNTKDIP